MFFLLMFGWWTHYMYWGLG